MSKIAVGQRQRDLGLDTRGDAEPLSISASRAQQLWDALASVYDALGFGPAAGGDEVSGQRVAARVIGPTSTTRFK